MKLDLAKLQTGRTPTSLQDAASMLQKLELTNDEHSRTVYRMGMDVIKNRFEQGRIVEAALVFNSTDANGQAVSTYGKGLVEALAEKAGMNAQTLRECHAVFRRAGTREGFYKQLARWEDQHIKISWNLVKNWGWKKLPDDPKKQVVQVNKEIRSIERTMIKAKDRLLSVREQMSEIEPERLDEIVGLAQIVVETIEEVQVVKIEGLPLEKPTRTLDRSYLAYVRSLACINCGSAGPSEPHHVDRGGMGSKGTDHFTIPVCATCHREIHDAGRETFWQGYDVWKIVAGTLAAFIEKQP